MRTYERYLAYTASYTRPARFFCNSYQIALFGRFNTRAISAIEYFFLRRIWISDRSLSLVRANFSLFSSGNYIAPFKFQRRGARAHQRAAQSIRSLSLSRQIGQCRRYPRLYVLPPSPPLLERERCQETSIIAFNNKSIEYVQ